MTEMQIWLWPNRKIDLNYLELGSQDLIELDRLGSLQGWLPPGPDLRADLQLTAKVWYESSDAQVRREAAHSWHCVMAENDGVWPDYARLPLGYNRWRADRDAASGSLYVSVVDASEARLMIQNGVMRAWLWLDRMHDAVLGGTTARALAGLSPGEFEKVWKRFRWASEQVTQERRGWPVPAGVLEKGWAPACSWDEICVLISLLFDLHTAVRGVSLRSTGRRATGPVNKVKHMIERLNGNGIDAVLPVCDRARMAK